MMDEEISQFVFLSEPPVIADLGMVFGAANETDLLRRARHGAELYRSGYIAKLMVTGGGVLAEHDPESKRMAAIAREHGVPDDDLIVEDRSSNTFENAQFSAAILQERGLLDKISSIILISSEWHMRRVLWTARRYFPANIRFLCCPVMEGCTRNTWMHSEACREQVLGEALLLTTFLRSGALESTMDPEG